MYAVRTCFYCWLIGSFQILPTPAAFSFAVPCHISTWESLGREELGHFASHDFNPFDSESELSRHNKQATLFL